jgi:hypothetical protein
MRSNLRRKSSRGSGRILDLLMRWGKQATPPNKALQAMRYRARPSFRAGLLKLYGMHCMKNVA